jgi:hypothetical protein
MIIDPYRFSETCDPDAELFITATGITNVTQKSAICKLVSALKTNNLWIKMKAIYPFVGGTATTHKYNLKNPLDTDAAHRIVFNGGWTHSSTGILANGVNAYANTNVPMNALSQNDAHISIYSRTNSVITTIDLGVQFTTISFSSFIAARISGNFNSRLNTSGFTDGLTANADSRGQYISWRTDGSKITTRKNNNVANAFNQTSTSAGANVLPYFIGNLNFNGTPLGGYYSNREYAFASLGPALTSAETLIFHTIVQDFETLLGRQV